MSVLFCYWGSICENGISRAFNNLGYKVISFKEKCSNKDLDTDYIKKLADTILNTSDIEYVFSVNYIPIIAKTCSITKTVYLSWVVDSPSYTLYSKSLESPYCHTFIFDYNLYEKYAAYFPDSVHYLALGADICFYDSVTVSEAEHAKYDCDVSFIGSFHTENCVQYDEIRPTLPKYMQGYIDGLIDSQLKIYGYYLIDEVVDDNFAESFRQYANFTTLPDYIMDTKGIVSDHYIGFKCNQIDRIRTLQHICKHYNVDLYTTEDTSMIPGINNRGIADSVTMMPKIFKCSKINLNITAKTIKSGIPQRVFDIMSAGGFVISNYQPEIAEYFTPGEDIVMYESIDDLIRKIDYYLNNDEERMRIAHNGYMKVKECYSYTSKLEEMINILINS